MDTKTPGTESGRRTLVITRKFNAPGAIVFRAWTDPAHLARWWGPKGFANPVCEIDLRPGGTLKIVMRGPDGAEHPMKGIFQEIVAPERLTFSNIALDANGQPLLEGMTRVHFQEDAGKTILRLETSATALVAAAALMLDGMKEGWSQSLDRLGEQLASAW